MTEAFDIGNRNRAKLFTRGGCALMEDINVNLLQARAGNEAPPPGGGCAIGHSPAMPRPLEIIRGLREIAAFLHVSHAEVLDMERRGAPIVRRKNILRAEKGELWEWLKVNSSNN